MSNWSKRALNCIGKNKKLQGWRLNWLTSQTKSTEPSEVEVAEKKTVCTCNFCASVINICAVYIRIDALSKNVLTEIQMISVIRWAIKKLQPKKHRNVIKIHWTKAWNPQRGDWKNTLYQLWRIACYHLLEQPGNMQLQNKLETTTTGQRYLHPEWCFLSVSDCKSEH